MTARNRLERFHDADGGSVRYDFAVLGPGLGTQGVALRYEGFNPRLLAVGPFLLSAGLSLPLFSVLLLPPFVRGNDGGL